MIGQIHNKIIIDHWAERNSFPRFIIITGRTGFGKSTMVKYITDKMGHYIVYADISVDSVREIIKNSYSLVSPTVYIFLNAHKMSPQAKNALLKVTEEPPNKAYFILTSNSMEQLLPTLESRCVHLQLEPYTNGELKEYCDSDFIKYAQCPGDIEILKTLNIKELEQFCEDIIDCSIQDLLEAFILCSRVKFKEDDSGIYDLNVVLSIVYNKLCEKYISSGNINYHIMMERLSKTRYELDRYNISKQNELVGLLMCFNSLWGGCK